MAESLNSLAVSPWTRWYSGQDENSYVYGDLKTLNIKKIFEEPTIELQDKTKYVINCLLSAMQECCHTYMEEHGASAEELEKLKIDLFSEDNFYGIRRYNELESMGPHPDRTQKDADTYTISVYLDDNYDGGELGIVHNNINKYIKAKAGSIIIFPSGYLHESRALTRGRKTMLTHVHTTKNPIIEL